MLRVFSGALAPGPSLRGSYMRIAFFTGIWPPDVGGPATHGPDFARFLVGRGHAVHVVTMGDGEPTERPCEVSVVSRRLPFPLRYGQVTLRGARAARSADVVYATATYAAAAAAATVARRPLVAKLVSDPAYERARRLRLFTGTLEDFQHSATAAVRALRGARTRALGTATAIVVPSAFCSVSLPTKTKVPGSSTAGSTATGGGAGFVSTVIRWRSSPQPTAISAR